MVVNRVWIGPWLGDGFGRRLRRRRWSWSAEALRAARRPGRPQSGASAVRTLRNAAPQRARRPTWATTSPNSFAAIRCVGLRCKSAVGLLKEEMQRLGSLTLAAARATAVPAGRALAVDRVAFSKTDHREGRSPSPHRDRARTVGFASRRIRWRSWRRVPSRRPCWRLVIQQRLGDPVALLLRCHCPHASTPIRSTTTWSSGLLATRKGRAITSTFPFRPRGLRTFRRGRWWGPTACHCTPTKRRSTSRVALPVEEMARRGRDTLAYGPMKPVGLRDPAHRSPSTRRGATSPGGQRPVCSTTSSAVQTKLRVARAAPDLPPASRLWARRSLPASVRCIATPSSMLRSTFCRTLELSCRPGLYIAGQMAGVEGYVESAALGFPGGGERGLRRAGRACAPKVPPETAHGALLATSRSRPKAGPSSRATSTTVSFAPLPGDRPRRLPRRATGGPKLAERALEALGLPSQCRSRAAPP